MRRVASALVLTGLSAAAVFAAVAGPAAVAQPEGFSTDPSTAPAGAYKLDNRHTSVIARAVHMGFSHFAMRFDTISGTLDWNGADPARSHVDVVIDPRSADANVEALNKDTAEKLFQAAAFPEIRFVSTRIERTGPTTGKIYGDLTLRGVTKPVVLDTVFNGTAPTFGHQRMGFSAKAQLKASDFGAVDFARFASDAVDLDIEAEFSK